MNVRVISVISGSIEHVVCTCCTMQSPSKEVGSYMRRGERESQSVLCRSAFQRRQARASPVVEVARLEPVCKRYVIILYVWITDRRSAGRLGTPAY